MENTSVQTVDVIVINRKDGLVSLSPLAAQNVLPTQILSETLGAGQSQLQAAADKYNAARKFDGHGFPVKRKIELNYVFKLNYV